MILDFAVGILFSLLTAWVWDFDPSRSWILLGIGFALLPDIDVLYEGIRRKGRIGGKELGGHREWTHYPVFYVPAALVAGWAWGAPVGWLLGASLFYHVLHDSFGSGWGVVWFGPFSRRHYKFFSRKDGGFDWDVPVMTWEREELKVIMREHGNDNWIRDTYMRPSKVLIGEIIGVILALLILFFWR